MKPLVTEEQIARQTPEAQAIIRILLAKIVKMEAEIDVLRGQIQGTTPQNSSLPPSTLVLDGDCHPLGPEPCL